MLVGAYVMDTLLGLACRCRSPSGSPSARACCCGVAIERLVFRPLIGQPVFTIVMASIALLILLHGVVQLIWGAQTRPFAADAARGS